jgi:hypothetical protein
VLYINTSFNFYYLILSNKIIFFRKINNIKKSTYLRSTKVKAFFNGLVISLIKLPVGP